MEWHPAKMAGPIGMGAQVVPSNHVLNGGPDPPMETGYQVYCTLAAKKAGLNRHARECP